VWIEMAHALLTASYPTPSRCLADPLFGLIRAPHTSDFEPVFMRKLYDFGFNEAAAGYAWSKEPPLRVDQDQTDDTSQ
jgi:hypothetical protein